MTLRTTIQKLKKKGIIYQFNVNSSYLTAYRTVKRIKKIKQKNIYVYSYSSSCM